MTHHHLHSSPKTCHWGFFEAKLKPVLTIKSGDEVTVDTISGGPDVVPDKTKFHVPPELADVHAENERMVPGHILTGPIAVEGAMPGDVLEVDILDVQLRQDWGYNLIKPLSGTLPDDFHETRIMNIPLDRERMVGRMPWGLDLPLKPFFGVMGTSPPPAWGRITSLIPRAMGGNLDNKELGAGAKLYLPVFVPGALFSCGDGHGVQGDGEVCVTAIETALQGRFRLTLRKDLRLDYPRAETATHYLTMAMDPDLHQDQALQARISAELRDSLDEELELELDDRELEQFRNAKPAHDGRSEIDRSVYFNELFRLQGELVKLQDWVQHNRLKVVIIFEG